VGSVIIQHNVITENDDEDQGGGRSTSPCHDTGADLSPYGITTDHEGNPRPSGAAYDMGAFELQE
jgi:hypothetical protein